MREISIDMTGGVPAIDIKIWNQFTNIYNGATLTLDTGAATTTISHDILDALGYKEWARGKKRIITASGIEYADEVIIDKLMIAGFELTNVEIYAHTFPPESFSKGVIGINVLSNFDLYISFQRKILGLTPVN